MPEAVKPGAALATKRSTSTPSITEALSEYATSMCAGWVWWVWRIMPNMLLLWATPSTVNSALKILWRQCSLLACANIMSSTSVGLRFKPVNAWTK